MTSSVLQSWVTENCSWKEQTVLLCALRGPDAGGTPKVKAWVRFIRATVLQNAAPHKTFMRKESITSIQEIADNEPLTFDMLPVHYLGHLMHALQVTGYRHPDKSVQATALYAYEEFCEYLHVNPESHEQMTLRLKDEV